MPRNYSSKNPGRKSPQSRVSAGLLMFQRKGSALELLLVHPGGPFFAKKDEGTWTIPKGEAAPGEDLLRRAEIECLRNGMAAALRKTAKVPRNRPRRIFSRRDCAAKNKSSANTFPRPIDSRAQSLTATTALHCIA